MLNSGNKAGKSKTALGSPKYDPVKIINKKRFLNEVAIKYRFDLMNINDHYRGIGKKFHDNNMFINSSERKYDKDIKDFKNKMKGEGFEEFRNRAEMIRNRVLSSGVLDVIDNTDHTSLVKNKHFLYRPRKTELICRLDPDFVKNAINNENNNNQNSSFHQIYKNFKLKERRERNKLHKEMSAYVPPTKNMNIHNEKPFANLNNANINTNVHAYNNKANINKSNHTVAGSNFLAINTSLNSNSHNDKTKPTKEKMLKFGKVPKIKKREFILQIEKENLEHKVTNRSNRISFDFKPNTLPNEEIDIDSNYINTEATTVPELPCEKSLNINANINNYKKSKMFLHIDGVGDVDNLTKNHLFTNEEIKQREINKLMHRDSIRHRDSIKKRDSTKQRDSDMHIVKNSHVTIPKDSYLNSNIGNFSNNNNNNNILSPNSNAAQNSTPTISPTRKPNVMLKELLLPNTIYNETLGESEFEVTNNNFSLRPIKSKKKKSFIVSAYAINKLKFANPKKGNFKINDNNKAFTINVLTEESNPEYINSHGYCQTEPQAEFNPNALINAPKRKKRLTIPELTLIKTEQALSKHHKNLVDIKNKMKDEFNTFGRKLDDFVYDKSEDEFICHTMSNENLKLRILRTKRNSIRKKSIIK